MTLLFKVEDVFDFGRGCVMVPAVPNGVAVRIRDKIQLRTPDGRVLDTHIASVELSKPSDGSACGAAIMLPRELVKRDVPTGTEVWLV